MIFTGQLTPWGHPVQSSTCDRRCSCRLLHPLTHCPRADDLQPRMSLAVRSDVSSGTFVLAPTPNPADYLLEFERRNNPQTHLKTVPLMRNPKNDWRITFMGCEPCTKQRFQGPRGKPTPTWLASCIFSPTIDGNLNSFLI